MNSEEKNSKVNNKFTIIDDILFLILITLISITAISIVWQRYFLPYKIPDILGYKFFMVLDGKMDKSISYGDLLITRNVDPNDLSKEDVVAFRNNTNRVTVHRVEDITSDEDGRVFVMQTASNEVGDTKYVHDRQVEGIIIHRIPKLGAILIKYQEPPIFLAILFVVVIIGGVVYYFAWKLDKKEMEVISHT